MRVAIYTQSGWSIGLGHAVRCGHLARELLRRGAEVSIVADRNEPGTPYLESAGAGWCRPMVATPCDVAVVDYMAPTLPFVRTVARNTKKTVVLVGAGWTIDRAIFDTADLLLYQTGWKAYEENPKVLSGGNYIILDPGYAAEPAATRGGDILLVCGGGIPLGYSASLADAMSAIGLTGVLVVGPQHAEDIRVQGWQTVSRPAGLRHYQNSYHLQVGTMGMATYEALAAGCVPIMVGRSQDHVNTAETLETLGCGRSMGLWDDILPERVADEAAWYILHDEDRERMRATGRALVDGKGVGRVAEAILNGS